MTAPQKRTWGGTTLEERRTLRRAAFLQAALDIIGEHGATAVTVRSLCREAGLTDRYFYESWSSRDDLLAELFKQVAEEIHSAFEEVLKERGLDPKDHARLAIETFVELVVDDPRKGRLLMVEPFTDPALTGLSIAIIPTFTNLVRDQLDPAVGKTKRTLVAVGIAGNLGMVVASWMTGNLKAAREDVIEYCVEVLQSISLKH